MFELVHRGSDRRDSHGGSVTPRPNIAYLESLSWHCGRKPGNSRASRPGGRIPFPLSNRALVDTTSSPNLVRYLG